jgi:hypothetical protein
MRRLNTDEFINRSRQLHGEGKYTYERTTYIDSSTEVSISCPEHGEFSVMPSKHLSEERMQGCKLCRKGTSDSRKSLLSDTQREYLKENWYESIVDLSNELGIAEATVKKELEKLGHQRPKGKNESLKLRATAYREKSRGAVPDEWHELPMTRSDARAAESSRYWDGRPCAREGHISPQKTSSGGCVQCEAEDQKRRISEDPILREKRRLHSKEYWSKNKREIYERWKGKWQTEEGRQWFSRYYRQKRENDPEWVIAKRLRDRLRFALVAQRADKTESAIDLLGCSLSDARQHIESLFIDGMTWDNYGNDGWHIDHLRPCNSFVLEEHGHQQVCFNWRNLQPLWGADNQSKSDAYEPEDEVKWCIHMRSLGFEGDLYLLYTD